MNAPVPMEPFSADADTTAVDGLRDYPRPSRSAKIERTKGVDDSLATEVLS